MSSRTSKFLPQCTFALSMLNTRYDPLFFKTWVSKLVSQQEQTWFPLFSPYLSSFLLVCLPFGASSWIHAASCLTTQRIFPVLYCSAATWRLCRDGPAPCVVIKNLFLAYKTIYSSNDLYINENTSESHTFITEKIVKVFYIFTLMFLLNNVKLWYSKNLGFSIITTNNFIIINVVRNKEPFREPIVAELSRIIWLTEKSRITITGTKWLRKT